MPADPQETELEDWHAAIDAATVGDGQDYERGWRDACAAAKAVCERRAETFSMTSFMGVVCHQEATKCGDAIQHFLVDASPWLRS